MTSNDTVLEEEMVSVILDPEKGSVLLRKSLLTKVRDLILLYSTDRDSYRVDIELPRDLNCRLVDNGVDSLDLIKFCFALEEEFEISISAEEQMKLTNLEEEEKPVTFADVVGFLIDKGC